MSDASLEGKRYSRWVVLTYSGKIRNVPKYFCVCDCGTTRVVSSYNLLNGTSKSCGCLHRERAAECATKHERILTSEYHAWRGAKDRCVNPSHVSFKNYGGRGIRMCDRWLNDARAFLDDMGPKPSPKHTIDRIDNDGDYVPGNCRWATRREQMMNRRNVLRASFAGEVKTVMEWSEILGIPYLKLRRQGREHQSISKIFKIA